MRGQTLAMAVLAAILWGFGQDQASAQFAPWPTPYPPYPSPYPPPYPGPTVVRTRIIDVNCTPVRIPYLVRQVPVPVPYPVPQPFPVVQPFPMVPPLANAVAANPLGAALPNVMPQPTPPAAAQPEPPRRPPVFTTPVATVRVQPVIDPEAATPEAEAARKLKLAQYLERDGMADKARQRYQEIVRRYPNTPAADEARQLLAQGG